MDSGERPNTHRDETRRRDEPRRDEPRQDDRSNRRHQSTEPRQRRNRNTEGQRRHGNHSGTQNGNHPNPDLEPPSYGRSRPVGNGGPWKHIMEGVWLALPDSGVSKDCKLGERTEAEILE